MKEPAQTIKSETSKANLCSECGRTDIMVVRVWLEPEFGKGELTEVCFKAYCKSCGFIKGLYTVSPFDGVKVVSNPQYFNMPKKFNNDYWRGRIRSLAELYSHNHIFTFLELENGRINIPKAGVKDSYQYLEKSNIQVDEREFSEILFRNVLV